MRRGRPPRNGNAAQPFPTLAQLGISKSQSAAWQRMAAELRKAGWVVFPPPQDGGR
jgi:hypothetical protein